MSERTPAGQRQVMSSSAAFRTCSGLTTGPVVSSRVYLECFSSVPRKSRECQACMLCMLWHAQFSCHHEGDETEPTGRRAPTPLSMAHVAAVKMAAFSAASDETAIMWNAASTKRFAGQTSTLVKWRRGRDGQNAHSDVILKPRQG